MNKKLNNYIVIIAYLIAGLVVMATAQLLATPDWLNSTSIVVLLFIVVNIFTAKFFQLQSEIRTFWSLNKIYFLPTGILFGALIAAIPVLAGLAARITTASDLTLNTTFTATSIVVTLGIVTWEELWFRGIFLNYCNKNLSAINISVTIGLLFMLVHLLNPEINLLKTGPTLFFAGAFLTIVYFYFKTIWLPIGLHFGNNYLAVESPLENHWLLGNEGYLGAIILAGLFFIFAKLTLNKENLTRSDSKNKTATVSRIFLANGCLTFTLIAFDSVTNFFSNL